MFFSLLLIDCPLVHSQQTNIIWIFSNSWVLGLKTMQIMFNQGAVIVEKERHLFVISGKYV